jgi:hypothetical protein
MYKRIIYLFIFFVILFNTVCLYSDDRNKFTFSQLEYNGEYNPYPDAWHNIKSFLENTVNMECSSNVNFLKLTSDDLFLYPFLCISGNDTFPKLNNKEKENLKKYLYSGGIVFINDTSLVKNSDFYISIKNLLEEIIPEYSLELVKGEDAIYKSYYLIKMISGRRLIFPYLEGIYIDGNLRVIFCHNDILGVWVKDQLGNYLYDCLPQGYEQRKEAFKLLVNIIVFSLTGTYKEDVIHKPYIEKKKYELYFMDKK